MVTIHTGVYCNNEYEEEAPQCAAFTVTEKDLERIKAYQGFISSEPDIDHIRLKSYTLIGCSWYEVRPLLKFSEFDRYITRMETGYSEPDEPYEFSESPSEARIDGVGVVITKDGFYFRTYGKYSGTLFESQIVCTADIEEVMASEPAPRAGFYFRSGFDKYPKGIKDAPLYINDDDATVKFYTAELLKSKEP
jgi:hypothetical protein